jgi:site-specific DNA-methyltransferase (adenine-specific)
MAEREVVGKDTKARSTTGASALPTVGGETVYKTWDITAPATDAAKQWKGWGTALKPALEPITVARKPLDGTVAENVLRYGTGAINVDGCRVGESGGETHAGGFQNKYVGGTVENRGVVSDYTPRGRWPANLIHDGSEEVMAGFPQAGNGWKKNYGEEDYKGRQYGGGCFGGGGYKGGSTYCDSGSAARFFYCAKASRAERDAGCEGFPLLNNMRVNAPREFEAEKLAARSRNHHPTVKPVALMRYLCRLVTPPGGTVLDPFMGSGSTGIAAVLEGFSFIGIERELEYLEIARARTAHALQSNRQQTLPL